MAACHLQPLEAPDAKVQQMRAGQTERQLDDDRIQKLQHPRSAVVVQQNRRQLDQAERQPAAQLAKPVELAGCELLSVSAHYSGSEPVRARIVDWAYRSAIGT